MACDNQQNEKLKIQPLKKNNKKTPHNRREINHPDLTVKHFTETFQRVHDLLGAAPCNSHLAKAGKV